MWFEKKEEKIENMIIRELGGVSNLLQVRQWLKEVSQDHQAGEFDLSVVISLTLPPVRGFLFCFVFFTSQQKWCVHLTCFFSFPLRLQWLAENASRNNFILILEWEIMHIMSPTAHTYFIWNKENPWLFSFYFGQWRQRSNWLNESNLRTFL